MNKTIKILSSITFVWMLAVAMLSDQALAVSNMSNEEIERTDGPEREAALSLFDDAVSGGDGMEFSKEAGGDEAVLFAEEFTYGNLYYTVSDSSVTITGCDPEAVSISVPTRIDGKNVTSIGSYAFDRRTSLENVSLSDGIRVIGLGAFMECSSLKSLTIPDSVTNIRDHAFLGCASMTSIDVGSKNQYYSSFDGILYNKEGTYLEVCPSGKSGDLIIPDGVLTIGADAFIDCQYLTSVTLPEGLTAIEIEAFYNCSGLTRVTIPESVTRIGWSAFVGCSSLTDIYYGGTSDQWAALVANNEILLSKTVHCKSAMIASGSCGDTLTWTLDSEGSLTISGTGEMESYYSGIPAPWYENRDKITRVVVERGVTSIGNSAFWNCTNLKEISLPNGMASIGAFAFWNCESVNTLALPDSITCIEEYAFSGCTGLASMALPSGITEIGERTFEYCRNLSYVSMPDSLKIIGICAFEGCSNLKRVELSDHVTRIERAAFADCSALTSIKIPGNCTDMGESVFVNCTGLKSAGPIGGGYDLEFGWVSEIPKNAFAASHIQDVVIPGTVTSIAEGAFASCHGLSHVMIPDSVERIALGDDKGAFEFCDSLLEFEVTEGNSYYASINGILYDKTKTTLLCCPAGKSGPIEILKGTVRIGECAFDHCEKITDISIPDTVVYIEDDAFRSTALTKIHIPDSVIYMGGGVFSSCEELETIIIPNSVSYMGKAIFSYCYALKKVGLPNSLKEIPEYTFYNCKSLETILLPDSIVDIGKYAFQASGLTSIVIPNGVTEIKTTSFQYSTISSITIPSGVTSIAAGAFYNCRSLKDVYYMGTRDEWNKIAGLDDRKDALGTASIHYALTVTLNPGNGALASASKKVFNGNTYGEMPAPVWNGYVFDGWYTAPTGGELITSATTVNAETDHTLYAHWSIQKDVTVPQVSNTVDSITSSSAVLRGTIVSDGGADMIGRKFYYFEKGGAVYQGEADDSFICALNNLKPSTEYWFFAQADNIKGSGFSETKSFTTLSDQVDKPASVSILPAIGLTMTVGQTGQLTARVLPEHTANPSVVWKSDDPSIAMVSQTGVVTALKTGETIVTVTTEVGRLKASCSIRVGEGPVEIDLSEWNMDSNTSRYAPDGWNLGAESGGNVTRAISYLSRWDGPVYESSDPYGISTYKEVDAIFHVQEVQFLRKRTGPLDNDEIKGALVRYGAVSASFLYEARFYNSATCSYYNPGTAITGGHAIAIVGWDDDYPAENFLNRPAGNGAFLCKNSYGEQWGDSGYFWISYYDAQIGIRNITAVFSSAETTDNYGKLYQYDPLGPIGTFSGSEENNAPSSWAANVFSADGGQNEHVQAVSFYTYDKGMRYEIYVMDQWTDNTCFSNLGQPCAIGTLEYAGYHTITLPDPVQLTPEQKFAVVIHLADSGNHAYQYFEGPLNKVGYYDNARANPGESWWSTDGILWKDLTSYSAFRNANFCIKAFTDGQSANDGSNAADVSLLCVEERPSIEDYCAAGAIFSEEYLKEAESVRLMSGDDASFGDEISTVPIGSSQVDFLDGTQYQPYFDLRTSGDVSGVRNQGAHNTCWAHAALASLESCLLRATKAEVYKQTNDGSFDGVFDGISDGTSLGGIYIGTNVGASLGNGHEVMLSESDVSLRPGATMQVTASIMDIPVSVVWHSSDSEIAQVDTSGIVTAKAAGTAIISATTSDGRTASCKVTVEPGCSSGVKLAEQIYNCHIGDVFLLDYEAAQAYTPDQPVIWSSSDPDIVQVDPATGRMTACGIGTANIFVTTSDGRRSDPCQVSVEGAISYTITGYKNFVYEAERLSGSVTLRIENPEIQAASVYIILTVSGYDGKQCGFAAKKEILPGGETVSIVYTDMSFKDVPEHYQVAVYLVSEETLRPLAMKTTLSS